MEGVTDGKGEKDMRSCAGAFVCPDDFDIIGQGLSWLYDAGTGRVFDFDMIGAMLSVAGLYFVAALFGVLAGVIEGMQTSAEDQKKARIQRKAILDAVRGTDQSSNVELAAEMMEKSSSKQ